MKLRCKFCKRRSPNQSGLSRHQKHCLSNPDRVPNTGGTKGMAGDPRLKRSDECRRKISLKSTGVAATPEAEALRRERISKACKGRTGGYRQGSGRGKKGTYKGIYCDSSWELAFVLWCRLKGYTVKRVVEKFPYRWQGKVRTYLPDFLVTKPGEQDKYVEVKGYVTPQWQAKLKAFPHKLTVVDSKVMRSIMPRVEARYGKSFLELYD